jgi:membrane-bound lytic murein transglycosylase D
LCAALLWAAWVRADNLFPQPAELTADVAFWKRVYTEVDTSSGLLHSARNLSVVYEVMRFPSETSPYTRLRAVEARKEYYRAILHRLAAGKRGSLTADEARGSRYGPKMSTARP